MGIGVLLAAIIPVKLRRNACAIGSIANLCIIQKILVHWVVLAAVGFAAMQVTVRKTISRIDPIVVNGLRLWVAAALVACIPGRLTNLFEVDYQIWLLAAATALFGPIISRIFLMNGLRYIPVALSTLVLFVAPVFAFLLGGLFFFEWPDLLQLTGCLIILTGIALPVLEKSKSS